MHPTTPQSLTIPEDGFAEVTIGEATINVDLYDAHDMLLEIGATVNEEMSDGPPAKRSREINTRTAAYLVSKGFASVSNRSADKFATALFKAVAALGKDEGTVPEQDSPASTVPQS